MFKMYIKSAFILSFFSIIFRSVQQTFLTFKSIPPFSFQSSSKIYNHLTQSLSSPQNQPLKMQFSTTLITSTLFFLSVGASPTPEDLTKRGCPCDSVMACYYTTCLGVQSGFGTDAWYVFHSYHSLLR